MKILFCIAGVLVSFGVRSQNVVPVTPTKEPQAVVLKLDGKVVDQSNLTQQNFILSDAVVNPSTRLEFPDTTVKCFLTFPDPSAEEKKKTDPKKNPK